MGKEKVEEGPVGGLVFLVSLVVSTFLAVVLFSILPWVFAVIEPARAALFLLSVPVGLWIAHRVIRGHGSVFLHELKHSILSNLSGNRAKGMVVNRSSGEFRYAYTESTAHMNAFISLAPYLLPLISMVAIPVALLFLGFSDPLIAIVIGVSFGIDLLLNVRDISPHQTDLTEVIGGYWISIWYVMVVNVALWSVVTTFGVSGLEGLRILGAGLWSVMAGVMGVG